MSGIIRLLGLFLLPIVIVIGLLAFRLLDLHPQFDMYLGDFVTMAFFFSAATAAYSIYVASLLSQHMAASLARAACWFLFSCMLVLIGLDEAFGIHEAIASSGKIRESTVMAIYGVMLVCLVFGVRYAITKATLYFLAAFVFCGLVSVSVDSGIVRMSANFGLIDVENQAEILGALAMASACMSMMISQIGLVGRR